MKILIYGAGVIGSLYAVKLAQANNQVILLARGKRLKDLRTNGLLYRKGLTLCRVQVTVVDAIAAEDRFDYVFLTVRAEQVHAALDALRENQSPTIVTMVNSLEPYQTWESIVGQGRILPAFPGAGGGLTGGVLEASLTPRLIQPTTFGEIDGTPTPRCTTLRRLFRQSGIPCRTVADMHAWQLCHLALVVPLADAYYRDTEAPETVGQDKTIMEETARQLRTNFRRLHEGGVSLSPPSMNLVRFAPIPAMSVVLRWVYNSPFADVFMYRHAMKARKEMEELHHALYAYLAQS